jgi:uncharacterized protein (DUF2461 family)
MTHQNRNHRLTVAAQEAFRQSITAPPTDLYDEIDELVADAELHLQPRSRRQANSVLRILDELETGRGR